MIEFRKLNDGELAKILLNHQLWLDTNGKEGECADLSYCDLSGLDLRGVDFTGVNITGTLFEKPREKTERQCNTAAKKTRSFHQPHNGIKRELTKTERREIRKLVKQCANHDAENDICLPLDCPCYMLGKCHTGSMCRWFREALLPTSPELMSAFGAPIEATKICPICGNRFAAQKNKRYCSAVCSEKARLQSHRERNNRYRKNPAAEKAHNLAH